MLFKICCKAPYQEDIRFSYNFLDCVYVSFKKRKLSFFDVSPELRITLSNSEFRRNLTKFRISSHHLHIESGRLWDDLISWKGRPIVFAIPALLAIQMQYGIAHLTWKGHGFYHGVGRFFFVCSAIVFKAFQRGPTKYFWDNLITWKGRPCIFAILNVEENMIGIEETN
jgi:hypothetical protein